MWGGQTTDPPAEAPGGFKPTPSPCRCILAGGGGLGECFLATAQIHKRIYVGNYDHVRVPPLFLVITNDIPEYCLMNNVSYWLSDEE